MAEVCLKTLEGTCSCSRAPPELPQDPRSFMPPPTGNNVTIVVVAGLFSGVAFMIIVVVIFAFIFRRLRQKRTSSDHSIPITETTKEDAKIEPASPSSDEFKYEVAPIKELISLGTAGTSGQSRATACNDVVRHDDDDDDDRDYDAVDHPDDDYQAI